MLLATCPRFLYSQRLCIVPSVYLCCWPRPFSVLLLFSCVACFVHMLPRHRHASMPQTCFHAAFGCGHCTHATLFLPWPNGEWNVCLYRHVLNCLCLPDSVRLCVCMRSCAHRMSASAFPSRTVEQRGSGSPRCATYPCDQPHNHQ